MSDLEQITTKVDELREDLTKMAGASMFSLSANKAAVAEERRRRDGLELRMRAAETDLATLLLRVHQLEGANKEHTGKIRTMELSDAREEKKTTLVASHNELLESKWKVYGVVLGAILPGAIALILQLLGLRGG